MPRAKGVRRSSPEALAARLDLAQHERVSSLLTLHRSGVAPLPASFRIPGPPLLEQGSTPTCFAHATAYATALAFAGKLFMPSPKLIAAGATAIDRGTTGVATPLDDDGGTIESVNAFMAQFGVEPMEPSVEGRNSDVSLGNMNDEINMADLNAAGQRIIVGQYGIDPTAADVGDVVCAALVAGIPIVDTFFCDSAFENMGGDMIAQAPDMSDPQGGGHATVLGGYDTIGGVRLPLLLNWWGADWCEAGTCHVSAAWLAKTWELWGWDVAKVTA